MEKLVTLVLDTLRRLAQGRARHRRQHGAVRRARVGEDRDRDDVADQGARRSRRRPRPGIVLNRDPGCHLENLKTTPPIEEVGDDLRRVRVLRAGLPEPEPDDDSAPADRPAPRDGAPAGRLAAAREADRGVRVRRPADLRRRRHLRDDLPARDRHRRPRQGAARRRALGRRGAGGAAGGAALGPRRGRRPLGPRRRRRGRRGDRRRRDERDHRRRPPRGQQPSSSPEWEPPMPPPAQVAMPPTVRDGAAAVYLPACVNRIFGRDRRRRATPIPPARPRSGGARRGLAARRSAALDPDRGRRHLLRDAVGLEGLPPRRRVDGGRERSEELWRWSDGGELPVVIDATSCTQGLLESGALLGEAPTPGAWQRSEILDSIAWAREPAAGPRGRRAGRDRGRPPDLLGRPTSASTRRSRISPGRSPTRSSSRRRRAAAGSPAIAASSTRS